MMTPAFPLYDKGASVKRIGRRFYPSGELLFLFIKSGPEDAAAHAGGNIFERAGLI